MKATNEHSTFECGPYKGYRGRAEYDDQAKLFHGQVQSLRDVVTFQGRTTGEVGKAFIESVDDYLAYCKERSKLPEKPFNA